MIHYPHEIWPFLSIIRLIMGLWDSTLDRAEWLGLTLQEACAKQMAIEAQAQERIVVPLKVDSMTIWTMFKHLEIIYLKTLNTPFGRSTPRPLIG
jgi:hypothetical protein